MASKLIVQLIKTAEPRTGRYTPWDAGLKGFGLRVNSASKSYVLKYLFEDRQR